MSLSVVCCLVGRRATGPLGRATGGKLCLVLSLCIVCVIASCLLLVLQLCFACVIASSVLSCCLCLCVVVIVCCQCHGLLSLFVSIIPLGDDEVQQQVSR